MIMIRILCKIIQVKDVCQHRTIYNCSTYVLRFIIPEKQSVLDKRNLLSLKAFTFKMDWFWSVAPSGEVESGNDEVQLSAVIVPVVVSVLVIVLVIVVFVAYRRGLFGSVFPLCSRNHSSKGTTEDTPGTDVSYKDLRRKALNDFVVYRGLNIISASYQVNEGIAYANA